MAFGSTDSGFGGGILSSGGPLSKPNLQGLGSDFDDFAAGVNQQDALQEAKRRLGRQLNTAEIQQIARRQKQGLTTGSSQTATETGDLPFQFRPDTLTGDAATLSGLAEARRSSDPVQQRLGGRALDTLARVNPDALLPIINQFRAQQNALAARQAGARRLAAQARAGQQSTLDRLRAVASGEDSVVAQQAKVAQDRLRQSIASRLASQRGGFNPGAQREGLRALSEGSVNLGAQSAAAQAEERRQALSQLLAGQAQLRQQDLGGLQLEGVLSGQQAGLISPQAQLLNALNAQRSGFFNQVFGRGDRAAQQALQAAGIVGGVPVQSSGPGPLQQITGLLGAIASPLSLLSGAFGGGGAPRVS